MEKRITLLISLWGSLITSLIIPNIYCSLIMLFISIILLTAYLDAKNN